MPLDLHFTSTYMRRISVRTFKNDFKSRLIVLESDFSQGLLWGTVYVKIKLVLLLRDIIASANSFWGKILVYVLKTLSLTNKYALHDCTTYTAVAAK